jgi:hypothetical protein
VRRQIIDTSRKAETDDPSGSQCADGPGRRSDFRQSRVGWFTSRSRAIAGLAPEEDSGWGTMAAGSHQQTRECVLSLLIVEAAQVTVPSGAGGVAVFSIWHCR